MKSSIWHNLFPQLLIGFALWHYAGSGNAAADVAQDIEPKTIAFRFDDVQDSWLTETQQAVIKLFAKENLKLSLAVVGGYIGKDESLVEEIRANRKILSLANHGLHAKNAADGRSLLLSQSAEDTREDLRTAENNISSVFGATARTFIPHQNEFDQNTLKILRDLGYTHISSACRKHIGWDDCMDDCSYATGGASCGTPDEFGLIHIPSGASANWQPMPGGEIYPIERILQEIDDSIRRYCFAVVMLHPQDFSTVEETLDPAKLESLRALLNEIKARAESLQVVWLEEIEPRCR